MERREIVLRGMMVLAAIPALTSCQAGSRTTTRTITAETLAYKYSVSVEAARREFDGKELIVKGYVSSIVAIPKEDESEGVVLLSSNKQSLTQVQCWFSKYESAEFEGLGLGRPVTVKGVFSGEAGIMLKFCKLLDKDQKE